jgi:hypothetical protein
MALRADVSFVVKFLDENAMLEKDFRLENYHFTFRNVESMMRRISDTRHLTTLQ